MNAKTGTHKLRWEWNVQNKENAMGQQPFGGFIFMFRILLGHIYSEFLKEFPPRFGVLKMHPHAINAWQLPPKNVARVGEMTHKLMFAGIVYFGLGIELLICRP